MLGQMLLLCMLVSVISNVCPSSCPDNQVRLLVSDTSTTVTGPAQPNLGPASYVNYIHPAWTAVIQGARWISDAPDTLVRTSEQTDRFFYKDVVLECLPSLVEMKISADNYYYVYVNGEGVAQSEQTNHNTVRTHILTKYFKVGSNIVTWRVRNLSGSSDYRGNPTGLMYSLQITT
jgi:hypothetical protein